MGLGFSAAVVAATSAALVLLAVVVRVVFLDAVNDSCMLDDFLTILPSLLYTGAGVDSHLAKQCIANSRELSCVLAMLSPNGWSELEMTPDMRLARRDTPSPKFRRGLGDSDPLVELLPIATGTLGTCGMEPGGANAAPRPDHEVESSGRCVVLRRGLLIGL